MRLRHAQSRAPALLAATALVAGSAAFAAPASAAEAPSTLGGYDVLAEAAPVAVRLFEPTLPTYSSPEAELDLGYTEITATTGPTGRALASGAWPGPFIGEALPLILDRFGLPKLDYPVRAVSNYPEGGRESNEPAPGIRQRAATSADRMTASVGIDPGATSASGAREDAGPSDQGDLQASGLSLPKRSGDRDAAAPSPLEAVVSTESISSESAVEIQPDLVSSKANTRVQDLSLVGGLITAESVVGEALATTDGAQSTARGSSRVTGLALAGNALVVDNRGVHFADKDASVPGLPDQADAALDELGIELTVLPLQRRHGQETGSADSGGLRVELDSKTLSSKLDALPLDELVASIPDEAGDVRIALQTALGLAPRIVVTVGLAETTAAGATGTEVPALPAPAMPAPPGSDASASSSSGSATSSTGAPVGSSSGAAAPSDPGTGTPAPSATAPGEDLALSSGLPKLASTPGALLLIALIVAGGLGLWFQRIGASALGAAAACSHGFASGTPNIRKVRSP
jgi:hypothetical protein